MKVLHRAEFLYSPDAGRPMLDYGVLVNQEGTILQVAPSSELTDEGDEEQNHQILMPGVLNAHIHLTDAARREPVPGGEGLVAWVEQLMSMRSAEFTPQALLSAVRTTIREMRTEGTVAFGEVENRGMTLEVIREEGVRCRFIHELIGFPASRAAEKMEIAEHLLEENEWTPSLAHALGIHAPYSVSFELMKKIADFSRQQHQHFYQHLAEDPDERDLYERGEGRWAEFLRKVGSWDEGFVPPGMSPIPYYDQLGILSERFVAVHLSDATPEEIALLARCGVKAILSPTSNLHITGLLPRIDQMVQQGMTLALGTDGRGSNPSMDVFDEASLLHERFPDLPAGTLLRALTAGGADVLGFPDLGRISVGTQPGLISIEVPEAGPDHLEEAILERGVERRRIV